MKKWLCIICGWIYDEAKGWPADGIAPGTRWEDIPQDWVCPECGVAKADFEMLDITEAESAPDTEQIPIAEAPIVIIGSGYAGYHLAEALRQRNTDKKIVIFSADDGANYSKPGLSNALTRGKDAKALISEHLIDIEQRLDIRIHAKCKVHSIDSEQHLLETDFGSQYYSKLILATGASPITLPIVGSGAADVLSINDLTDYRHFRQQLAGISAEKKPRIAIIGNGLIGCEFANDLSNIGCNIDVIGLTAWPMDKLLPQEIANQLQQKLTEQGVSWQLENTVQRIDKLGDSYQLLLADGQHLEADLVLSAVGLKPRTALAASAGISCHRGIVVNGGLRTDVPDIYALGDCAEIKGQLLPFIAPITHSVRALADCLLGRPTMALYPLMPVIVKTPALPLTILTPPPGTQGAWQVEDTPEGKRAFFKDSNNNLLGFVLSGDTATQRQHWLERVVS